MRLVATEREKELLDNAKRSLVDCLAKVKAGEYQESLRILLIGIDTLANLQTRLDGQVATEIEAGKANRKRFIAFLRADIPEWKEHQMQWEGRTIRLDLSELSYDIRCRQVHEYSDLSSATYPVQLKWDHPLPGDPALWICGKPNSAVVNYVEVNGFSLLQRLVMVAQKYVGIFSSTATRGGARVYPHAVHELLGTVRGTLPLNRFGFPSADPDAVW